MKTLGNLLIAGVAGTTLMTLYSFLKARKERQEYVEPVLLNKLIDYSENLPEIKDNDSHSVGWGLHYAAGVAFMGAYYLLWKKVLVKPTPERILIAGVISGSVGIGIWKLLFTQHENPPQNHRYSYYRQLLTAHIVFSLVGITTYKVLDRKAKSFT